MPHPLRFLVAAALANVGAGLLCGQSNYATPYTFTTLAGVAVLTGSTDGTGSGARFQSPQGVAVDNAGNVYVADTGGQTIRKITPAGVVTTFAGLAGTQGSADGTGSNARFNRPSDVAVDGDGNVYVSDTSNFTIRKISPAGVVTTLAGTPGQVGSDDGTGGAASFFHPAGIAVDTTGNVYVAETVSTVRKITPGGVVTTLAGTAFSGGSQDGTGTAASFSGPLGVAVDGAGNVYVADSGNHTIRKITPGRVVTTIAGTAGVMGANDGTGSAAQFYRPSDVTVDGAGNLYVTDLVNETIRKITPGGVVTTVAGSPQLQGFADGVGSAARFAIPTGVAADASGNVYVADLNNCEVRKVSSDGTVTTFAGMAPYGMADGAGIAAGFHLPAGMAVDGSGTIYVADTYNCAIRKMTANGVVTTFAGLPGTFGWTDGTGTAASLYLPQGVAVDGAGNLFVTEDSNIIRKITSAGVVTTLAGTANYRGTADGSGAAARFDGPRGIGVDQAGNIFVADRYNYTIRKLTPSGVVTTFAGTAHSFGSADGMGAAARFSAPNGLVLDPAGNVYVADLGNNNIRKITPAGLVTTFAGAAGIPGSTDGQGTAARFNQPADLSMDSAGNIFVVEAYNATVRKISPAGVVTTLAGLTTTAGVSDGTGSAARFNRAMGITVDGAGIIYVADTNSCTIRRGVGIAANDFNADGQSDIVWQNTSTGDRGFWLLNGTAYMSWVSLGVVSTDWRIAATADFNADGKPDILWDNTSTGDRGFWLMNGTSFASWVGLGVVSTNWRFAAAADFNGDGKPDILMENTVTGDRGFWLMNGTAYASWVSLGNLATDWRVATAADFNADGQTDILWENTVNGARVFWLMNGTNYSNWVSLPTISTDWHIAATGDFNADGKPDLVLENTVTGDRGFWLLNGTTFSSWAGIGVVTTDWHIAN